MRAGHWGFILVLIVSALAPTFAAASKADRRFEEIYTREWQWRQEQQAGGEDNTDIRSDHFPSLTPETQAARLAYLEDVQSQLGDIRVDDLSAENKVNFAIYSFQIDILINRQRFRSYEKPLNADSGFWTDLDYVARGAFRTEADYRNWIGQMNDLPRYFDEQIANMRAGLARGFTPPKITLVGRDATIASIAEAGAPEDTVFYLPFETLPSSMPAQTQNELRDAAKNAILGSVIPAYQKLLAFMREDYAPNARTSLAAEALPDGKAYYQSLIREYTTLDMSPEEIHAFGLAEVASIREQMLAVMKEVGFKGGLPAFLNYLRTDPQFYVKKPEDLLKEAAWIAKQVDGKIGLYFGRLPRQRFTVRPVPADLAPVYTAGRGGPGAYLVNTYDLKSRPLYALRALTLHEAAPGHAFQMPLARENENQPAFRRGFYVNAYGEGWALYCEWLGDEMGMYETPYDRFGMLSYQMWRASRLVVDTGIHAKGWTREQAQNFLRDNTALSTHEIETEVDRYISWPGQALSYYMGETAIRRARAHAEEALGDDFNIRAFHDAVLELGSAPLPVLEQHIDDFIARGGVGPYPDEE